MSLNILIVDDSSIVRQVISRSLHLAGLPLGEIHQAENGQVGLQKLAEHWVDLVFCDLSMPVLDGLGMIEQMRQDGLLCSVPVIVVTADGSRERRDDLLQKGVTAYLRKPFQPEELRDIVMASLEVPDHA